ncbi:MAG: hypothetical protein GXZ05_04730 [Gammaproteobacteria bacterium]|jgi:predicted nucleic acid-binding Zn ribbon protein|nr:hypothetical protein [Gammaproteobacteria bacterium]
MAVCLFCQEENPSGLTNCKQCGMALPKEQEKRKQKGIARFVWFVILLALFCAAMIVWLPRTPPVAG